MNVDLLIKALVIMLGLIVLSRLIWPMIQEFLSGQNNKKDHDLDAMIQRKIDLMKATGIAENKIAPTKSIPKENRIDYLDFIKQEFRALSTIQNKDERQKQTINDLKRILSLFDALQWGQSEELSNVRKNFEKHFDYAPDETQFIKAIRIAYAHAPLISEKKQSVSFDTICELLNIIVWHENMAREFANSGTFVSSMKKRWHTKELTLKRAWIYELAQSSNKLNNDFIETLLNAEQALDNQLMLTLLGHGPDGLPWKSILKKSQIRSTDLVSKMRECLGLMQSISTIEYNGDLSEKQALEILGFENIPAPGVLSRRYKKLAKIMHPDHLESKGFPQKVMTQANENFKILKNAYELLKNDLEN